MSDPMQITQKGYWVVNGTNHSSQVEAFQDAGNRAQENPGATVVVQPPSFEVIYTPPKVPSPPVDPPPSDPIDPPPPADGATNIGAIQPGDSWTPPDVT